MQLWYSFVDSFLPFSWTQHLFMKNALLAVLFVTPIFGIMGTMVVNNRMSFFSDSLGHSALTGIAIGVVLGIPNPLWSMIFFSLIFSAGILMVKRANTASTDTIIGVFSSVAVALGIVMLSRGGGFNKYSAYLIGDLLSIKPSEVVLLGMVLLFVVLIWIYLFNKLLVISVNESLAGSRGIRAGVVEILFTFILAVTVMVSIQWVGLLIINSLLILPAAAARNISANVRQYHIFSILISMLSGISGLVLSYYWGTASGATIILVAAALFFVTLALRRRYNS